MYVIVPITILMLNEFDLSDFFLPIRNQTLAAAAWLKKKNGYTSEKIGYTSEK